MPLKVLKARRDNQWNLASFDDGSKGHQCDSGLERKQVSLIVRASFREHSYATALTEHVLNVFENSTLIDFGNDFVLVNHVGVVHACPGFFENDFCVVENLFNNLLLHLQLPFAGRELYGVTYTHLFGKQSSLSKQVHCIVKLHSALAALCLILSSFHRNRLRPGE